jgi:transcriptional regulator with XRE-family HTH domain
MEDVHLSKRIKELRAKKGFSQEQLAEESGLSLRTIQRMENGETVPRGDTLKRLAVALKVSPDEIIDWQIMEDKNVVALLNLSQFGYLAFPLLGIIIPLAIWILKKDKVKDVNELGKAIINFQISWVIILFLSYGLIMAALFFQLGFRLSPFSLLFIMVALYAYNGVVIVVNTIKIQKGDRVQYKPAFPFLH